MLAADHVIKRYPIMPEDHPANGDFGADQFYRGLGNFARQNNLWPKYEDWFVKNADSAWTNRRADYNISQNNLTRPTPTGNLRVMEAEGLIVLQAAIQTSANAAVFSGPYRSSTSPAGWR